MILFRRMLELFGIEPDRVVMSWISAAQGQRFAEMATEIVERARELGPIKQLNRNYLAPWTSSAPELFEAACANCKACPTHAPAGDASADEPAGEEASP